MTSSTYDLFISHSSYDRPWAERLFTDLHTAYPWIRIFWDRDAIPPGGDWRTILTNANFGTKHLITLWSDKAAASKEVTLEIAHFHADVQNRTQLGGSDRQEFPIVLQGKYPGGGQILQGFPELAKAYDPNSGDRGTNNLNSEPAKSEWTRAIRMIGDAIKVSDKAHPVIAVIVATNTSRLPLVDAFHGALQNKQGRTLEQFLKYFGLLWNPGVRDWYGSSALEWRPFGGQKTIVDLLEDLRVDVNARIVRPSDHFKWEYIDPSEDAASETIDDLPNRASVVIADPVSCYDTVCANFLRDLNLEQEQSAVAFVAPVQMQGEDLLSVVLRTQLNPILDNYFLPPVDRQISFAQCAVNVQRASDIERLVRYRLGTSRLAKAIEDNRGTTSLTQRQ